MKITAADTKLKIAFRFPNKQYGVNFQEGNALNEPGRTSDPFEEIDIEPGQSWDLPSGGTLVFVREYLPTPDVSFLFANMYRGGGEAA